MKYFLILKTTLSVSVLVMLLGCSSPALIKPYIRDRGKDYKTSTLIHPLTIPSDLKGYEKSDVYPISGEVVSPLPKVSLLPPGF